MDFDLKGSQKEIQKAAREFAKGEFDKDLAANLDKEENFPEALWKKAARLGLVGLHLDGAGLSLVDQVLVAEQFCAVDSSLGSSILSACRGAECLYLSGDASLKETFLERVLEGQILSTCAFAEPGGDPDLSDITTTAIQRDKMLTLNGKKEYVVNGVLAGCFIVLCRVLSEDGSGAEPCLVLVEKKTKGVLIKPKTEKLGCRMIPVADMEFCDVAVPLSNMVGKPGTGLVQAKNFLSIEQVSKAAMVLGMALGALQRSLAHTRLRKQFNQAIAAFEVTRHKFADMAMRIRMARLLTLEAAFDIDRNMIRGKHDETLAAMALFQAAKTAVHVTDESVQLLGGYGYMAEYEVERFYRDAKSIEITQPAGLHLKEIVAKKLIGKIRAA
ncbi:MAG: acyl-CoA/acyl-ACP dehydrogenase [Deltaproteobacteria bacterium]|nr:acyl-CoA/acyl-ACP dehydrogenase [Deltaproteobacteria bacterium]